MSTYRLTLLPAGDGDCLLLTWGDAGTLHHMIIDGGRAGAYPHLNERLEKIAEDEGSLELYVLTHVDADHIEGALSYLRAAHRPVEPKAVWFNGYRQMRTGGVRSIKQGDDYSKLLANLGWPLNPQFANGVASIENAAGAIDIAGLRITMLSPDASHLKAFGKRWDKWLEEQAAEEKKAGREGVRSPPKREHRPIPDPLVVEDLIADGDTDTELPNGSSIAFVAEWMGVRVLFGGDAHPELLAASIKPFAEAEGGRYRVDLLKASHHGSRKNTTRQLVELLDCKKLVISTNGNLHGHPDPETPARFIRFGTSGPKEVYFNYRTDRTRPWDAEAVQAEYDYRAFYPAETEGIIEIDLLADR